MVKNPPIGGPLRGNVRDADSICGSGEDPLEEGMAPTLEFLPGEPHGQRSLAGYSAYGHKELVRTEATKHACQHQ